MGVGVFLTLSPTLGTTFFLLDCLVQPYCILLCNVPLVFLGALLFSEGKWRSNGSGGEGRWGKLERVEGGEAEVKIYCMREE